MSRKLRSNDSDVKINSMPDEDEEFEKGQDIDDLIDNFEVDESGGVTSTGSGDGRGYSDIGTWDPERKKLIKKAVNKLVR